MHDLILWTAAACATDLQNISNLRGSARAKKKKHILLNSTAFVAVSPLSVETSWSPRRRRPALIKEVRITLHGPPISPDCCSSLSNTSMGDNGDKVQLYVYDLSNGLARQLSPMLLNKQVRACLHTMHSLPNMRSSRNCLQIDGIWHTSIVVAGLEYYYGGGVNQARPGSTPFGQPLQVVDLGYGQAYSLLSFGSACG